MKMTITEKILARGAGLEKVVPDQLVLPQVDLSLANDITAPLAIEELKRNGIKDLADPDRIVLVPDHFTPNKDIASAEQCRKLRQFAFQHNISHYYEVGKAGIEHALLPEEGLVIPGSIIIGADSHTCTHGALGAFATGVGSTDVAFSWITGKCWFRVPQTIKVVFNGRLPEGIGGKDLIIFLIGQIGVDGALYKSLEFCGTAISSLPMDERLSLCNMAIEAGGKNGIIAPDAVSAKYLKAVGVPESRLPDFSELQSDPDCEYAAIKEFDISKLEPQVAFPHLPSNALGIAEAVKRDVPIDQVIIGSCTNGRITDLRTAAAILRGKKVHAGLRLIVIPATQKIYVQAMEEGLLKTFIAAGAVVSPPTCGPCLGGHMGVLASGERALATTNRNFVGRMGHLESEVYLAGPAVAAATAIKGKIADFR